MGIGCFDDDSLVVSSFRGHCMHVFRRDGTWERSFGEKGTSAGLLYCPREISIDADDNVLISSDEPGRVQVFRRDGTFVCALRVEATESFRSCADRACCGQQCSGVRCMEFARAHVEMKARLLASARLSQCQRKQGLSVGVCFICVHVFTPHVHQMARRRVATSSAVGRLAGSRAKHSRSSTANLVRQRTDDSDERNDTSNETARIAMRTSPHQNPRTRRERTAEVQCTASRARWSVRGAAPAPTTVRQAAEEKAHVRVKKMVCIMFGIYRTNRTQAARGGGRQTANATNFFSTIAPERRRSVHASSRSGG